MKKSLLILVALIAALPAWCQEATPEKTFWDDPFNNPLLPVYLLGLLVIVVVVLVLVVAIYTLRVINMLTEQMLRAKAKQAGVPYQAPPSRWSQFWSRLNKSVPVEKEKTIELDHSYDGIRELDNHLPPWWKWLFYGTIAWSVVYLIVYHVTQSLPLSGEEYQHEVALAEEQAKQFRASQLQAVIDENTLEYTPDAAIIEKGKSVFMNSSCGSCHRNDGGGNTIGPNLTDKYWLHGGDVKNIFSTIKDGVVEKGMPAWGKALSPQDVRDVTFFVMSLQGTNPPDAKGPQGELFEQKVTERADTLQAQASLQ